MGSEILDNPTLQDELLAPPGACLKCKWPSVSDDWTQGWELPEGPEGCRLDEKPFTDREHTGPEKTAIHGMKMLLRTYGTTAITDTLAIKDPETLPPTAPRSRASSRKLLRESEKKSAELWKPGLSLSQTGRDWIIQRDFLNVCIRSD